MADHESSSNYKSARALGRRYQADRSDTEAGGYLLTLDDIIKGVDIVSELNLGTIEIPLNKIIGTRTSARSTAFAGNFMPLLDENTEFGAKWKKLYNAHIDEGIRDPIKAYEYINRYFVIEGNKRVSVLKYLNGTTVRAKVTRIIPKRDETNKIVSMYYEFLDFDRRASFSNLWFSKKGSFTRLVEIVEEYKADNGFEEQSTAELISRTFNTFRIAYKNVGMSGIPITSGDAFLEFVEIFGFDPAMVVSEYIGPIKRSREQFMLIADRGDVKVTTIEMIRDENKTGLSFFSKRPRKLKVAFAFESLPELSLWTNTHHVAMKRLQKEMGDKVEVLESYRVPVGDAYLALDDLMKQEPDILFATSPNMSGGALRLSLEHPDKVILNCDGAQPTKNMMTYFPKVHEAAFLCGILAGAMTRSNIIGYMSHARFHRDLTYGVNAFTLGARLVNPKISVYEFKQSHSDFTEFEHIRTRYEMSKRDVDIAYCMHQLNTPTVRKGFPEVYAQVYILDSDTGSPTECIGAAALDWSVFYNQIVGDSFTTKNSILDITRSGYDRSVHFGWGLDTGIIDVLGVDAFMGHNAVRLMRIFKELVASGQVKPFDGPLVSREGKIITDKDDTLTLLEIQNMDWLLETVVESIVI